MEELYYSCLCSYKKRFSPALIYFFNHPYSKSVTCVSSMQIILLHTLCCLTKPTDQITIAAKKSRQRICFNISGISGKIPSWHTKTLTSIRNILARKRCVHGVDAVYSRSNFINDGLYRSCENRFWTKYIFVMLRTTRGGGGLSAVSRAKVFFSLFYAFWVVLIDQRSRTQVYFLYIN